MSLATRERGLKRVLKRGIPVKPESLATRERGLKLAFTPVSAATSAVACYTRAWIETTKVAEGKFVIPGRLLHASVD